MNKRIWVIGVIIGLLMLVSAGVVLVGLEQKIPRPSRIDFKDQEGVKLMGSYYPGKIESGILICEGFGSDQTAMRSLVYSFTQSGYHVMTFDFSGHGLSSGGLGFDNAETDRLAWQVAAAASVFQQLSGLSEQQIIYLGHSLGARVALQSAVIGQNPPAGLILLGTQVNLVQNLQSEVFTGVSDADLDWVESLGPTNPESSILLISGDLDDILTPVAAGLLIEKLSGRPVDPGIQIGKMGSENSRRWLLIPDVVHNFEIYHPVVLKMALKGAEEIHSLEPLQSPPDPNRSRQLAWLGGFSGLFLILFSGIQLIDSPVFLGVKHGFVIENPAKFFFSKIIFWLPALIPGALLGGIVFLVPMTKPVFNLIYVSFLGGYGILLFILYETNRMPGVEGKLGAGVIKPEPNHLFITLLLFSGLLICTMLLARSGLFFVIAPNQRLAWAFIFTPITALGFWIGWQENAALSLMKNPGWKLIANGLIGLLPFFLWAGFLGALGSLSGLIGALYGLLILFLAVLSGTLLLKVSRSIWLTSVMQAFFVYWLILPQGAMFI